MNFYMYFLHNCAISIGSFTSINKFYSFIIYRHILSETFYYATIAYHVGLNAVLGLPHPGPTS